MGSAENEEALRALDHEIRGCERCDLYRTATRAVPGDGPVTTDIMLVGEAPGFNEDKQGRPFVGAAGKFLDELLGEAGIKRSDVYITNVVKHRPPNNRDPQPDEVLACRPWLEHQLALVQPRLVVTLGRHSLGTFFPGKMISRVHGQIMEKDGIYFFAMYHPAAALHQSQLKQTLINDMRKLGRFIAGPFKEKNERPEGAVQAVAETTSKESRPAPPGENDEPEQLSMF